MVSVEKYTNNPDIQYAVLADDQRWKVLVDSKGIPHLCVRCTVADEKAKVLGWVFVEDLLPEGVNLEALMTEIL